MKQLKNAKSKLARLDRKTRMLEKRKAIHKDQEENTSANDSSICFIL